ncbi:MAG TPA: phosphatase PAP2 family protein [Fulvivirga sp.]|nr:phosphatase PAP2 family protein [Fulvivirga sp.]
MVNIRLYLLVIISLLASQSKAQVDSTLINKHLHKANLKRASIAPLLFMGVGTLTFADIDFIGRADIYEERNERTAKFKTHADDYLQYAPIATVLGLNVLGVKGKHNFKRQMWLLAKSELVMMAIVEPLKKVTEIPRPDGTNFSSFPSGHTAQAFVAATFIHKEYGGQNPLYSVLGFGSAAAVGVLRILNNRHWTTDVFFGAGIGILSTNLVYLWADHQKSKHPKMLNIIAMPTYGNKIFGIGLIIPLK